MICVALRLLSALDSKVVQILHKETAENWRDVNYNASRVFSLIHSSSLSISPSSVMDLILVAVFVRSVYRLDAHTYAKVPLILPTPSLLRAPAAVSLMCAVCSLLMSDHENPTF